MMRQCMDADNLHRRLSKIIGQVQAIDRMIDEDIPCEDVLAQINAAKSALHKVGQVVLEGHINHCVRDGIEHGDADKTIESFTKAVERFANMIKFMRYARLSGFSFRKQSGMAVFFFCPLTAYTRISIIWVYPYRYKEDFDETVYGQIGTYLGIRRHKKRDCRIRHFRSRLGFQPFWT